MVLNEPTRRLDGERGVTIVLVGLLLTGLMLMAAFVTDLGNARQVARFTQAGTDGAALAAAQDLPKGLAADNAKSHAARLTARDYIARDLGAPATGPECSAGTAVCSFQVGPYDVTVETPYTLPGSLIPSHNLVMVRACRDTPSFFGRVVGSDGLRVCRSSVARNRNIIEGFGRGLIALNPSACPSLQFDGSSTTNLYSDGAIIVESSCPTNALDGGGKAWEVQAGLITVVGHYNINPCTEEDCLNGITPIEGVAPLGDPLSGLPEPSIPLPAPPAAPGGTSPFTGAPCTQYQPGYYNDIKITGDACFAPGLYYIQGGKNQGLSSTGNGFLHGNGVIFFVKTGRISLNGTGSLRLEPPASGPYAGITLFQAVGNTEAAKINGNNDSSIGTIYLPSAHLDFQGNASPEAEDFVKGMVVADTVTITGNGYLSIDAEEPDPVNPPEDDIGLER